MHLFTYTSKNYAQIERECRERERERGGRQAEREKK
jgi:hypothetical protein